MSNLNIEDFHEHRSVDVIASDTALRKQLKMKTQIVVIHEPIIFAKIKTTFHVYHNGKLISTCDYLNLAIEVYNQIT